MDSVPSVHATLASAAPTDFDMVTAGEHLDGYADTPAREVTYRDGESILDASILPPASGRAGRNDGDGVQDDAKQAASGPTAFKLPERTGGDGA